MQWRLTFKCSVLLPQTAHKTLVANSTSDGQTQSVLKAILQHPFAHTYFREIVTVNNTKRKTKTKDFPVKSVYWVNTRIR